jgi:hypothetical protein
MIPIIFGYRSKPTIEGGFKNTCPSCRRKTIHGVIRVTKWFTLFFIPVIPFSNKLFVGCNVCGMRNELKGEAKQKMSELISRHKCAA